jgi:hypothetical protein
MVFNLLGPFFGFIQLVWLAGMLLTTFLSFIGHFTIIVIGINIRGSY